MSVAKRAPLLLCPNCQRPLTTGHTMDTGAATERPDHACPVLWERRRPGRAERDAERTEYLQLLRRMGLDHHRVGRSLAEQLGQVLMPAIREALSPFAVAPTGPMHCHCGPLGHRCVLQATLRWGADSQWTPDGWRHRHTGEASRQS